MESSSTDIETGLVNTYIRHQDRTTETSSYQLSPEQHARLIADSVTGEDIVRAGGAMEAKELALLTAAAQAVRTYGPKVAEKMVPIVRGLAQTPWGAAIVGMAMPGQMGADDWTPPLISSPLFDEYGNPTFDLTKQQFVIDQGAGAGNIEIYPPGERPPAIPPLIHPSPGFDTSKEEYPAAPLSPQDHILDGRGMADPVPNVLPGTLLDQPQPPLIYLNENVKAYEIYGVKVRSISTINSAGDEVVRNYVANQDDLLRVAEGIAGGRLDNFIEKKDFWYHSPDGNVRVEWNPEGHLNTNEGPHVTHREFDGKRHSVVQKYFIYGWDNHKPDWTKYKGENW